MHRGIGSVATIIAPKAPLFQRPKVSNGSCLFVCSSHILVIFAGTDCTGFTPFSRSCHFNLDFRESPKITKKLRNRTSRSDPAGPRFGTLFWHFFLKKFRFSLEGLVTVRQLILARTTGGFAQPCPAGQSSI